MKNSLIKKTYLLITIFSLILCNLSINVNASNNSENLDSKKAEIKMDKYDKQIENNLNALVEEAQESKIDKEDKKATLKDNKGNSYDVTMYNVSTEEICESGDTSIIASTYVYDLSDSNIKSNESNNKTSFSSNGQPLIAASNVATLLQSSLLASTENGETSRDKNDKPLCVNGYCTIYYTISTDSSGVETYKLTKVSGGYTKLDSQVRVTKQVVTYGESGVGPSGAVQLSTTKNPTSTSWSYKTGYTKYITLDLVHAVGVYYKITIQRNSSTWYLEFENNL